MAAARGWPRDRIIWRQHCIYQQRPGHGVSYLMAVLWSFLQDSLLYTHCSNIEFLKNTLQRTTATPIVPFSYMYSRVGWYWNWDKNTPEVCYIPFKRNVNKWRKCFDPVTASSLVKTFWVMHYIEVKKNVHNMDFMGIKRCRILCRFQKYILTLVTKCT
jgi:hypothetical protein